MKLFKVQRLFCYQWSSTMVKKWFNPSQWWWIAFNCFVDDGHDSWMDWNYESKDFCARVLWKGADKRLDDNSHYVWPNQVGWLKPTLTKNLLCAQIFCVFFSHYRNWNKKSRQDNDDYMLNAPTLCNIRRGSRLCRLWLCTCFLLHEGGNDDEYNDEDYDHASSTILHA